MNDERQVFSFECLGHGLQRIADIIDKPLNLREVAGSSSQFELRLCRRETKVEVPDNREGERLCRLNNVWFGIRHEYRLDNSVGQVYSCSAGLSGFHSYLKDKEDWNPY